MDDDALRARFGEVRGVIDEWAVFAPVETDEGTLWRGIRASPWRPGDEAWLLVRAGRWRGLRPVFGVPFTTFLDALEGRPVPRKVRDSLLLGRVGDADGTFIGFDGAVWTGVGVGEEQARRSSAWQLVRERPTDDAPALTDLLAGLWPDEAREDAVRREELEVLSSTILRRWTTVDILGDRGRSGADRRIRHTLSLLPDRHPNLRGGVFWAAYRLLLRPRRVLQGPGWPWMPRIVG